MRPPPGAMPDHRTISQIEGEGYSVERMLQGNGVGPVQVAPGEEPALGNLSRAILMTRDRGGSLRQAKSLIEFRQAAFQRATPELDWFQLPWKQIFSKCWPNSKAR